MLASQRVTKTRLIFIFQNARALSILKMLGQASQALNIFDTCRLLTIVNNKSLCYKAITASTLK